MPASDLLPKEALSTDRTELVISPVKINCGGYDGSIFDKDIKLTLPMPEGASPEQCLFGYYDEEKKEDRYFFPDSCDPGNGTMTLNLPHFSLWWSSKPTTEQQIDAFLDSYCTQLAVNRGQSKKAAADLEQAVGQSDIVLTATPSYAPLIRAEWVRPGTHLSCIGADMSGKEELDPAIFRTARAFGDDRNQCFSVGECEIPHREGLLTELTEIGDVLTGKAPGRTGADEITVYDSTGIALQDLASAAVILIRAEEKGVGLLAAL